MSSTFRSLEQTVSSLQGAVDSTCERFTASMQQGLGTMQTVNALMEKYLLDSLSVSGKVAVAPNTHEPSLHVSITPMGLPIDQATITTRVVLKDGCEVQVDQQTDLVFEPQRTFKLTVALGSSLRGGDRDGPALDVHPTVANEHPSQPDQSMVDATLVVECTFPSPGTQQQLCKTTKVAIVRWSDLCLLEPITGHETTPRPEQPGSVLQSTSRTVSAVFLRSFLRLTPAQGIPKSASYRLSFSAMNPVCDVVVDDISEDGERVSVTFSMYKPGLDVEWIPAASS